MLKKELLNIIAIFTGIATLTFSIYQQETIWTGVIITFLFLIFGNIEKIKKFKAGFKGIEAGFLQEAKNTLNELQQLAVVLSTITQDAVEMSGRLGGFTIEETYKIRNDLYETLKKIGVDEKKELIHKKWKRFRIFDLISELQKHSSAKDYERIHKLRSLNIDDKTIEKVIEIGKSSKIEKAIEVSEDLEHLLKTGELKDLKRISKRRLEG
jgi:hypothetical protein